MFKECLLINSSIRRLLTEKSKIGLVGAFARYNCLMCNELS